jgi:GNAT superfamily N-acetyltransferase
VAIRALREGDDRSRFRSGDADLDRFFVRFAAQNMFRHYVGVTYVAAQDERVHGFATVAPGHIEIERLPVSARRGLPRYPLPMLRLARLAVDEPSQGRGVGADLLRFVLRLALRMAGEVGCVGVIVDAKAAAVGFYERYGFERIEAVEGQSDARPEPTLLFLSVTAIRRAVADG